MIIIAYAEKPWSRPSSSMMCTCAGVVGPKNERETRGKNKKTRTRTDRTGRGGRDQKEQDGTGPEEDGTGRETGQDTGNERETGQK